MSACRRQEPTIPDGDRGLLQSLSELDSQSAANQAAAKSESAANDTPKVGTEPESTLLATPSPPSRIASFCGDCHAVPRPEDFPREVWYDEIRKGFEFYARSARTDLDPPAFESVVRFYREHAPPTIHFPRPLAVDRDARSRFKRQPVSWSSNPAEIPAVSSLQWIAADAGMKNPMLVATEMRDGTIRAILPDPGDTTWRTLAKLDNPARITACDFDGDRRTDIIVSDLGSFHPYDHQYGRIVWLKPEDDDEVYSEHILASGLGRVADVAVDDFAGDEQLDLIVAEFGNRTEGSIRLLENMSLKPEEQQLRSEDASVSSGAVLNFRTHLLDPRPGTIRVLSHDWNGDGRQDAVALISQEFETLEMLINGERTFNRFPIWSANNLNFGSVALDVVDLDNDGDLDLLFVNGDCFDNNFANRTHGIQWLENIGNQHFRSHRLCDLPGAYCAIARDLDGDGDKDILATANLPSQVYPQSLRENDVVSILMLEQTSPLEFKPRVLEAGTPRYPTIECADFNGDGKLDFAVGAQLFGTDPVSSAAANLPAVAIWWQQ